MTDDAVEKLDDGDEGSPYEYSATCAPGDPGMRDLLCAGSIEVLGRMPWSSNATFLVEVRDGDLHAPAVYKPERGEQPLWDFPPGLWRREVAAHELSAQLGFGLVPPTVARTDAPLGTGSLQAFVPARFEEHYFTMRDREELGPALRRLCAFDLVANSADRKGGHCLLDEHDRVWAIDNGLCFHEDLKLRTVIWDFAGEAIPAEVADALTALLDVGVGDPVRELLSGPEAVGVVDRAAALLSTGRFPHDPTGRRHPWPLV
jgi:uncharacterized repeat protein (TIGR03843 family)